MSAKVILAWEHAQTQTNKHTLNATHDILQTHIQEVTSVLPGPYQSLESAAGKS